MPVEIIVQNPFLCVLPYLNVPKDFHRTQGERAAKGLTGDYICYGLMQDDVYSRCGNEAVAAAQRRIDELLFCGQQYSMDTWLIEKVPAAKLLWDEDNFLFDDLVQVHRYQWCLKLAEEFEEHYQPSRGRYSWEPDNL